VVLAGAEVAGIAGVAEQGGLIRSVGDTWGSKRLRREASGGVAVSGALAAAASVGEWPRACRAWWNISTAANVIRSASGSRSSRVR
jgi:hypothetical protein